MMRIHLHTFCTVLSASMMLGASTAWAAVCAAPEIARVDLRLIDPAPKVVRSSSLHQINSKAKAHGLLKRGNLVLGLTQSEVETSMNIQFRGFKQDGRICLTVRQVDARFGHSVLAVQVPREYALGSCQYTTVLKHEMEHVRVNREGVRKYAKLLKRELERALIRFNPRQVNSMKRGQAEAQRVLQNVVTQVTKQFHKEINTQHASIDKPGGPYDASGACRNW